MSGRKDVLAVYKLVDTVSGAADITSAPVNTKNIDNLGIQTKWTGDLLGVQQIQASLDYEPGGAGNSRAANAGNWVALSFNPSLGQPAGAAGGILINLNQLPYPWIRFKYTADGSTPGTGNFDVWVTGRQV